MRFLESSFKKIALAKESKHHVLKGCPLTKGLNFFERKKLLIYCEPRTYIEGEVLFNKNDPAKALYIICDGEVEIFNESSSLEEEREKLGAQEFLGEAGVILKNTLRTSTAQCSQQSSLLILTQAALEDLAFSNDSLGKKIYANLAFILAYKLKATQENMARFHQIVSQLKNKKKDKTETTS